MKPSNLYVTFMSIGECADLGSGPTIVAVYEKYDQAMSRAGAIRVEVAKKWGWEGKELNKHDKELLLGTAEVITLDEAIKRIKEDIHEEYLSQDPGW